MNIVFVYIPTNLAEGEFTKRTTQQTLPPAQPLASRSAPLHAADYGHGHSTDAEPNALARQHPPRQEKLIAI
eukprot:scaffold111609_cov29-Prasinocladus_malaysianus.AAC.1